MTSLDAEYSSELIARRLGLPIRAVLASADRLLLTPSEIHENEGFGIEVRTGWRSIEVRFVPGRFSRPLINKMGRADEEGKAAFSALALVAGKHGKVSFRVNGTELSLESSQSWPSSWEKVELNFKKSGVVVEELHHDKLRAMIGDFLPPMFGMCIALIGIADVEADEMAAEGMPVDVVSRRYERKAVNREICLSLRGRRCYCCNMDFGEVYGSSADGFIEVHHITAASEMGPNYRLNPAIELVPLCSNCHSVVHLSIPAKSVEELRTHFKHQPTL